MRSSHFTLDSVLSYLGIEVRAGAISRAAVEVCELYAMVYVSEMYGIEADGWASSCGCLESKYPVLEKPFKDIRQLVEGDLRGSGLNHKCKIHWFPRLLGEVQ